MSRNLRARLDRLESRPDADSRIAPPGFWDGIAGVIPLEQLEPETRRLIESMRADGSEAPDLIEERIRRAARRS